MPDVLVDAEHLDTCEAGRVGVRGSQERSDRLPDRAPAGAELAAEAVDGGVLAAQLVDRPPAGAGRELGPRGGDPFVLLDERGDRAGRLGADPAPLAPADPHRSSHRRRVDQAHLEPAMTARDDAAGPAAHHTRRGLHRHCQGAAAIVTVVAVDSDDAQAFESEQQITAVAVAAVGTAARRRLTHRRGPQGQER